METTMTAPSKTDRIKTEMQLLRRCDTTFLRDEYKRAHRVSDTSGMTKSDLVLALLCDKFGAKNVSAALLHL